MLERPLRDSLEPTDFADADCRVSPWVDYPHFGNRMMRVWVCKCGGGYWFQRHEWQRTERNSTDLDNWIFAGYWPLRQWGAHMTPAPKDYNR
jgi:hypothetical protein